MGKFDKGRLVDVKDLRQGDYYFVSDSLEMLKGDIETGRSRVVTVCGRVEDGKAYPPFGNHAWKFWYRIFDDNGDSLEKDGCAFRDFNWDGKGFSHIKGRHILIGDGTKEGKSYASITKGKSTLGEFLKSSGWFPDKKEGDGMMFDIGKVIVDSGSLEAGVKYYAGNSISELKRKQTHIYDLTDIHGDATALDGGKFSLWYPLEDFDDELHEAVMQIRKLAHLKNSSGYHLITDADYDGDCIMLTIGGKQVSMDDFEKCYEIVKTDSDWWGEA